MREVILEELKPEVGRVRVERQHLARAVRLLPHGIAGRKRDRSRIAEPPHAPQGAEVVIERTVLLHQDDDVLDVFDRPRAVIGGDGQRALDALWKRGDDRTRTEQLEESPTIIISGHWDLPCSRAPTMYRLSRRARQTSSPRSCKRYRSASMGVCIQATSNLASGVTATDNPASPPICPIARTGLDAETPAVDLTNEVQGAPGENNIDGVASIPAATGTVGRTIADQLVAEHRSWKSYQENLPVDGADNVNYSDGFYTNNTNFSAITPVLSPPLAQSGIVALYAAKHDPFVYFKSVQDGTDPGNSLADVVSFEGADGLFADLGRGTAPAFSFIAPNQCNDQHGRGNGGPFCNFDPTSDGSQAGLNPALISRGDVTVQKLVAAIHGSRAWRDGNGAIVIVWDENDYSMAPNINQVAIIVDTNYGTHGASSARRYTHFSLLKSMEAGFKLPCLNHACDDGVIVMSDLFAR